MYFALPALAFLVALTLSPHIVPSRASLTAAGTPSITPCKPKHLYIIMPDGKSQDLGTDERFPEGRVWFQTADKKLFSRKCTDNLEATADELSKEALANVPANKIPPTTEKMLQDIPLNPTDIRSDQIGAEEATAARNNSESPIDTLNEVGNLPQNDASKPWEGRDIDEYLAEQKQQSFEWRKQLQSEMRTPEAFNTLSREWAGPPIDPNMPLPQARPGVIERLLQDPSGTINDISSRTWEAITGSPVAPAVQQPSAPSLPPPEYTPNFDQVFDDIRSAPLQTLPPPVPGEPNLFTQPAQPQTAYPITSEMQAAYEQGPVRSYDVETRGLNQLSYVRDVWFPVTFRRAMQWLGY